MSKFHRYPVLILVLLLMVAFGAGMRAARAITPDDEQSLRDIRRQIDELKLQSTGIDSTLSFNEAANSGIFAVTQPDEYVHGRIMAQKEDGVRDLGGGTAEHFVVYAVRLDDGPEKGTTHDITISDLVLTDAARTYKIGDRVAVVKSYQPDGGTVYYIADHDRTTALIWIAIAFFAFAVVFGRWRGFSSLLGLATTVLIIVGFVVPGLAAGRNPLYVSLAACAAIATVSLYLAHGFNRRTTIAYVSTLITLAISAVVAVVWVKWAHLFGAGSEDALYLQGGGLPAFDLRGLLLGGILLGVVGILDDITTAQAAVVEELKAANASLQAGELYRRALSVGREHIASLVNTLFLAYAGASLPVFLLFSLNSDQPLWYILNSETIAEEIIRTLVGSVCLILAVPITTAIAAKYYGKRSKVVVSGSGHTH